MIRMYNKLNHLKVLSVFLENPYEGYFIREMARIIGISPMTVKRAIDSLESDGMVTRKETKGQDLLYGNMDSKAFRYLKLSYNLTKIEGSGLVDHIIERTAGLTSLVLYGSYSRGEDSPDSDIDLLVISRSRDHPDLKKFEGKLSRSISLKIFTPSEWDKQSRTNKAFYMAVITEGIVLHGRRPIVA